MSLQLRYYKSIPAFPEHRPPRVKHKDSFALDDINVNKVATHMLRTTPLEDFESDEDKDDEEEEEKDAEEEEDSEPDAGDEEPRPALMKKEKVDPPPKRKAEAAPDERPTKRPA